MSELAPRPTEFDLSPNVISYDRSRDEPGSRRHAPSTSSRVAATGRPPFVELSISQTIESSLLTDVSHSLRPLPPSCVDSNLDSKRPHQVPHGICSSRREVASFSWQDSSKPSPTRLSGVRERGPYVLSICVQTYRAYIMIHEQPSAHQGDAHPSGRAPPHQHD